MRTVADEVHRSSSKSDPQRAQDQAEISSHDLVAIIIPFLHLEIAKITRSDHILTRLVLPSLPVNHSSRHVFLPQQGGHPMRAYG